MLVALRKSRRFCIVLNSYIINCRLLFFIIGFLANEISFMPEDLTSLYFEQLKAKNVSVVFESSVYFYL